MFHDLSRLDVVKICPHCDQKMSCCEAPPIHIGDGLGWGSDVLFICLNDACSVFLEGWDKIEAQYGHHASYRYMELPDSPEKNYMMVGNADAFKACVVNKEDLRAQNKRYSEEKKSKAHLETCVAEKDTTPILALLLDDAASKNTRLQALDCMQELGDLSVIDALRNHSFRENSFENTVNLAISKLLKDNFRKECPECSELVKLQAKKCMHCKADLSK